jgi:hypothetical protein
MGCPLTIEANKAVMHHFTEFINTATEKLAAELIAPKAVFDVPGRSEPMRGPAGYLAVIGMMRGGFHSTAATVRACNIEQSHRIWLRRVLIRR